MRAFSYSLILAGSLMMQSAVAMDKPAVVSPALEAFLDEAKAAPNADAVRKLLEVRKAADPEKTWTLCREDILGNNNFYKRVGEKEVGISKRNAITNFCESVRLEREKSEPGKIEHTKSAPAPQEMRKPMTKWTKKEPATVPSKYSAVAPKSQKEPEKPQPKKLSREKFEKWKKVDVEAPVKGDLQERQAHLKVQETMVQENIQVLKSEANPALSKEILVLEQKLVQVKMELEQSQKFYDNLSAAIFGIREDLGNINHFKQFVAQHSHDAPDVFIDSFMNTFQDWFNYIVDAHGKPDPKAAEQIPLALDESRKALEHLKKGELELAALVRQMEDLRKK